MRFRSAMPVAGVMRRVSVDVALGRFNRAVTGEKLDIMQAAAHVMYDMATEGGFSFDRS